MIRFLRNHQDIFLAVLAVAFLVMIAGFYAWGLRTLGEQLGEVAKSPQAGNATTDFNFDLARRDLQTRGFTPP